MQSVTIILPTLNEAANLPIIVPRIASALGERPFEVIVVDDNSRDNTLQVCRELSEQYPLRLHVRLEPKAGLSGAVLTGMAMANGDILLVMDADLQHPPAKIPELLAPIDAGDAEFVVGSRYVPGGSTYASWSLFRNLNSRIATLLARPFAGGTSDPMSGFFALSRVAYERAEFLTPLGYKIGLELMCKCRPAGVREIPIHFANREHGESKLTTAQQFKYLEHLSRLYDFSFPRSAPMLKFLIVLATGWLVAFGSFMTAMAHGFGWVQGPALAYGLAIAATAVFHFRYVRTDRELIPSPHPWCKFWLISMCEWTACTAAAWWLSHRAIVNPPEMFVLCFGCAALIRYVMRKELLQDLRGIGQKRAALRQTPVASTESPKATLPSRRAA